jgi:hypothetical protein
VNARRLRRLATLSESHCGYLISYWTLEAVLRIRIRMFLNLLDPDPDPLVRETEPVSSFIKQK